VPVAQSVPILKPAGSVAVALAPMLSKLCETGLVDVIETCPDACHGETATAEAPKRTNWPKQRMRCMAAVVLDRREDRRSFMVESGNCVRKKTR